MNCCMVGRAVSKAPLYHIREFSTTMPHFKRRAVAGSFIFRFPDNDTTQTPQVALFKRSDKVRTYQHKYAPVSGSVEETDSNPLATAWRELQEETSLDSKSLCLFRQGKPYSFVDESVGREWAINPFSFTLRPSEKGGLGEEGIKLDWEHDRYDWFEIDDVKNEASFQGVPRLLESLRRVWFNIDLGEDAGQALGAGLRELQTDHSSGARQLASKAMDIYIQVIARLDISNRDIWWKNVRIAGWHLWKNGRETMGAPILSVMQRTLSIIEKALPSSGELPSNFVDQITRDIEVFGLHRETTAARLGAVLSNAAPASNPIRIMTLSSSSTIVSAISNLVQNTNQQLDIRILESRPLFEGVDMAQKLTTLIKDSKSASKVSLYTDACAAVAAKDTDMVLIGADLIDKDGNVSNKTGSLPAILAARYVAPTAKVMVLAEKEKILPFDAPGHEENDAVELTRSWGTSTAHVDITVKNVYFEWVPRALIHHYITEDGILDAESIAQLASEAKSEANRLFDGI